MLKKDAEASISMTRPSSARLKAEKAQKSIGKKTVSPSKCGFQCGAYSSTKHIHEASRGSLDYRFAPRCCYSEVQDSIPFARVW